MAQTIYSDTVSNPGMMAGATITKHSLLKLDASNNYPYVIPTAGTADVPIYIALADAVTGEIVQVAKLEGITTLRASTAISEDALVSPAAADGEIITATTGYRVIGKALEAALAADDEIRCAVGSGFGYLSA